MLKGNQVHSITITKPMCSGDHTPRQEKPKCHNQRKSLHRKEDPGQKIGDIPDGTLDKNMPASAGLMGSISGLHSPQASEQLSLCTTTTKPVFQSLEAITTDGCTSQSLCSATREVTTMGSLCSEKPVPCREEQPQLVSTRESPHTAAQQQKKIQHNKINK